MAGDLLLTNIDEHELSILLGSGGALGDTIFHADKYDGAGWEAWGSRLEAGLGGGRGNNRVGLPPHFYISFSKKNFNLKEGSELLFAKVIGAAIRPLTIVSTHAGLGEWSAHKSNDQLLDIFTRAMDTANVTLEVYSYEGKDLIDRASGEVNEHLSYMRKADE